MGATSIEWCDYTFNPWRGCARVSEGCRNCYAEKFGRRQPAVFGEWGPTGRRVLASENYWRQPERWNVRARREGRRFRVFCGSLMDVFEDRPELAGPAARDRLWHLISLTESLDWLLLTKRPQNFRRLLPASGYGLPAQGFYPNVWLGVSVEDQRTADERIPLLLQTPAALRFVSVEPLLGPVNLTGAIGWGSGWCPEHDFAGGFCIGPTCASQRQSLAWVIVGSESGPKRRTMDEEWARAVKDQCVAAGVPFFFKQAVRDGKLVSLPELDGRRWAEFPRGGE